MLVVTSYASTHLSRIGGENFQCLCWGVSLASGPEQNGNSAGMWLNWRLSAHSWDVSKLLSVWFGQAPHVVLMLLTPTPLPFLGIPHFSSRLWGFCCKVSAPGIPFTAILRYSRLYVIEISAREESGLRSGRLGVWSCRESSAGGKTTGKYRLCQQSLRVSLLYWLRSF